MRQVFESAVQLAARAGPAVFSLSARRRCLRAAAAASSGSRAAKASGGAVGASRTTAAPPSAGRSTRSPSAALTACSASDGDARSVPASACAPRARCSSSVGGGGGGSRGASSDSRFQGLDPLPPKVAST